MNCGCCCLAQKLFCFQNQSSMMMLSKSPLPTVDCKGITYFFLSSKKIQDLKNHLKNTHGCFHWFISNRAKDIKHLRTVRHLTEHCHESKYPANHVLLYVWNEMRCYKWGRNEFWKYSLRNDSRQFLGGSKHSLSSQPSSFWWCYSFINT